MTVINPPDMSLVLNMKSVVTVGLFSRAISNITMRLVLFALSSHVAQNWWSQRRMTVHLDGPRSIMGTWWLHVTIITTKRITFVLTKTQSMLMRAVQPHMAPCCATWKGGFAALFHVVPIFSIESWHALFAPSENELSSTLATFKKLYRLILSIEFIMWEIIFAEGRTVV